MVRPLRLARLSRTIVPASLHGRLFGLIEAVTATPVLSHSSLASCPCLTLVCGMVIGKTVHGVKKLTIFYLFSLPSSCLSPPATTPLVAPFPQLSGYPSPYCSPVQLLQPLPVRPPLRHHGRKAESVWDRSSPAMSPPAKPLG
jgi:hypothetical protein